LKWKSHKQTRQYQALLLSAGKRETSNKTTMTAPSRDQLRQLLFICDNMWEKRELLPELQKFCAVALLDVHEHIEPGGGGSFEQLNNPAVIARLGSLPENSFDAVLIYLRSSLLSAELVESVRKRWKCPVFGLNLDCKTSFADYDVFRNAPVNYEAKAGLFDCNLTNARAMLDVYADRGFPVLYLPTGYHYDPAIHTLRADVPYDIPISFVGSCKPERAAFVERLRRLGVEVQVFGQGWDGASFVNGAWNIYRRTQLNLGIGYNVPDSRFTNLKNRDFECPGSCACYLTTYDWELAGLFDLGKEILCYRNSDDFVELYTYYARRPQECFRIAQAGFNRCIREHTWEHRFRRVFEQLGFRVK
jgi:hypothetical protein